LTAAFQKLLDCLHSFQMRNSVIAEGARAAACCATGREGAEGGGDGSVVLHDQCPHRDSCVSERGGKDQKRCEMKPKHGNTFGGAMVFFNRPPHLSHDLTCDMILGIIILECTGIQYKVENQSGPNGLQLTRNDERKTVIKTREGCPLPLSNLTLAPLPPPPQSTQ
jgi:hypothetical protein